MMASRFPRPTTGAVVSVIMLAALWCGLWGNISTANVLAGLGIGIIVQLVLRLGREGNRPSVARVHPIPLLNLTGLVLADLVISTVSVAVEVLTPTDRTDEAVIDVEVGRLRRPHLLLLTVAITLTPGTAVVDVDEDTGTLTLHLLHANRVVQTRQHIDRLAELAAEALPFRLETARATDADTDTPATSRHLLNGAAKRDEL